MPYFLYTEKVKYMYNRMQRLIACSKGRYRCPHIIRPTLANGHSGHVRGVAD